MVFTPHSKKKEVSVEYLFTEAFLKDNNYTAFKESEKEASLHQWNNNHWLRLDLLDAKKIALDWMKTNQKLEKFSSSKAGDCINTLTTSIRTTVKELTPQDIIIPLSNHWLNVKPDGSIECKSPDKSLRITYSLNVAAHASKVKNGKYTPSAALKPDSKWQAFLDSSVPDKDVQKTLQEYIGYTLIPNVDLQVALFCEGEGSNGKGVFFEVVAALHQKERVKSINMERLDGFGLTPLIDASLILVPECGRSINEEMFKSIIAGDPIPINRKNRDEITIRPKAKWLISCNNLPTIKDQTDGMARRMICVEWTKQFKEEEKIVGLAKQIIDTELEEVLDWALNGLLEVLKRDKRKIFVAQAIQAKKEEHLIENNNIKRWLSYSGVEVNSETDKSSYLLKETIYNNYTDFCEEGRIVGIFNEVNFWKEIKRAFPNQLLETRRKINKANKVVNARFVNLRFPDQIPAEVLDKKRIDEIDAEPTPFS